jgi:hypothetical protein
MVLKREGFMNKRLHYICYILFSGLTAIFLSFTTGTTAAMAEQPECEIKYTVFLPAFMFESYVTIVKKAQKIVQATTMKAPNCDTVRKTVMDMSKLNEDYVKMISSTFDTPKSKQHTETVLKFKNTYIKIHILKDGLYAYVRIVPANMQEVRKAIQIVKEADKQEGIVDNLQEETFVVWFYD